jgi:hypothetical protein
VIRFPPDGPARKRRSFFCAPFPIPPGTSLKFRLPTLFQTHFGLTMQ